MAHVCPWWGGYFIDNRLRRWLHNPGRIVGPYVGADMTVLDFGCGMGMFGLEMARRVGPQGKVVAVDLQQPMLDVLMARAAREDLADRVRPHRCPADTIGLTEPVDFALAFYSAHETPDPRRLIGEITALVKPAGRFLLVEPILHVTRRTFRGMIDAAEAAGLRVEDRPAVRLSHSALFVKGSNDG